MGICVKTLRNWEQRREGPARVLLQVAAKHPQAIWKKEKAGQEGESENQDRSFDSLFSRFDTAANPQLGQASKIRPRGPLTDSFASPHRKHATK
jgi:hypothetical protein